MDENEQQVLMDISEKLDRLIGLSATQGREKDQQIAILKGMGYDWKFIGLAVGLKPDTAKKRYQRCSKNS